MKQKEPLKNQGFLSKTLKQITGIEPASSAWEADVLPMYYICTYHPHIILLVFSIKSTIAKWLYITSLLIPYIYIMSQNTAGNTTWSALVVQKTSVRQHRHDALFVTFIVGFPDEIQESTDGLGGVLSIKNAVGKRIIPIAGNHLHAGHNVIPTHRHK